MSIANYIDIEYNLLLYVNFLEVYNFKIQKDEINRLGQL